MENFVNKDKIKVMHFRNKRKARYSTKFMFDGSELEIVKEYNYLGAFLDEYFDFNATAKILEGAAGTAFGAVLTKFGKQ